jgi:hypothetical protein
MCLEAIAPIGGKLNMNDLNSRMDLRPEIKATPNLEIVGETEWPFDVGGNLPGLLAITFLGV